MNTETVPDYLAIQQPCRKYGMDEGIHPVQIAAFRRMTPGEKFAQVVQMYHMGISFKIAGLRMQHPDWSEDELRREAQRISTYGTP
jgi:hypothetical protein